MRKTISILFISSEIYPFAKEGGVGDVSYSLPLAIRDLGHDIRVMLPKYGCISERKNKIHEINRLRDVIINVGDQEEFATIKSSSINNPRVKVQAYVTTNSAFYDERKGVMHDPDTWEEYEDNAERFIFFSKSVLETCNLLGWYPDIIHCNDWQSGLIPAYLRTMNPNKFKKTKIVYTIHNFYDQGVFPLSIFNKMDLPKEVLQHYKHKNQFNFLKGGLHYSNYITTVSPAYAQEILAEKELSNGLNTNLKEKIGSFLGIPNGTDSFIWNPRKDDFVKTKLSDDIEEFKYDNKVALLHKFDLEFKPKTPLLSFITKLTDLKGIDLILDSLKELLKLDIQLVMLAQGKAEIREKILKIEKANSKNFKVKFAFEDEFAHLVQAGSDIYLSPSKHEASGLSNMHAINYGTIPVVRLTGGTKEYLKHFNPETGEGNSVTFTDYTPKAFVAAVKEAINLWSDKEKWSQIVENGINQSFSWKDSANRYVDIYKLILKDNN